MSQLNVLDMTLGEWIKMYNNKRVVRKEPCPVCKRLYFIDYLKIHRLKKKCSSLQTPDGTGAQSEPDPDASS